jgi:glucokinase
MNIIGVDIGGTKCAVILGFSDGPNNLKIIDKIFFPTETKKGVQSTLNKIFDNIELLLKNNFVNRIDINSIGISCGGPLDSKRGIIMSPPNLMGWNNIKIVDIFEKKYNIKTKLQNDANACALAEWKFGAGRGCSNVVFLTFGTGLGAGLILNGSLYTGTNDMAGEVGHIRLENNGPVGYGKAGSFEGFCSGGGIAQIAKSKVLEKLQLGQTVSFCRSADEIEKLDAKTLADAAMAGDELASEVFRISGYYFGKGLSILIDVLNPEVIIAGSIFARSSSLLWEETRRVIEKEALPFSSNVCRIVSAELGDEIGDYAALATAMC